MGRQEAWGTLGGLAAARSTPRAGLGLRLRAGLGIWPGLAAAGLLALLFFSQSRKRGGRNENRDEETWTTSGDGAHEASRVQQASAAMVRRASQGERGRAAGQTPDEAELLHGDGGSRYLW